MFCWGETVSSKFVDMLGKDQYDAIEVVNQSCVHQERHWYQDYDLRVRSFHPDLRFGWDRVNRRFLVYKLSPGPMTISSKYEEFNLTYLHHFIDPIVECKTMIVEDWQGGARSRIERVPPGEWIFRELARSPQNRFDPDGNYGMEQAQQIAEQGERESQKELRDKCEDIVSDAMTLADKGNPQFVRTAVRVPEKAY